VRLEIPLKKLAELVNHMIEVVDGLFIDPLKSVFLNHIPDFAKEVAENELWENLAKLPDEYNSILNNALVLLCDILTEMPETMTNSAIGNLVGTGVITKFNDFAKSSDDIDYETLSFILQLGCKVSVVPGGMEILLENNLIKLAFDNILKRSFVLANNKRFAGSDSTNA
jgi:hypothetical protein